MFANSIICDVCGKHKGSVNHWWLAWTDGGTFEVESFRQTDADTIPQHLCGQDCVIKAVNKWMQEQAA